MSESESQGFKGLHSGLKDRSPEACDKSCELPKGPSVDEGTRTSVAETPPTLGPRNA
jgi:hypothetical protein